jgi:hypothetical protein
MYHLNSFTTINSALIWKLFFLKEFMIKSFSQQAIIYCIELQPKWLSSCFSVKNFQIQIQKNFIQKLQYQ